MHFIYKWRKKAEDAAAGFRLLLPLPDMDGESNLTKGAAMQCGCAADLVAGAGACKEESTPGCVNTGKSKC
jgi:hypothetical protein